MPETAHAIGVDVGGTTISAIAVASDGSVIHRVNEPSEIGSWQRVLAAATRTTRKALAEVKWDDSGLLGIGFGVPGNIRRDGTCGIAPNLTDQSDYPIREKLQEQFSSPVKVVNDVNAAAFGEFTFGAGQGVSNFLMITIGTGIGGGVIVDSQLQYGPSGSAGEIGHMTVEPYGPQCTCGNHGCLEALAAKNAIIRRAAAKLEAGRKSSLTETAGSNFSSLNPAMIAHAASNGDVVASETLEETGIAIGIALANVVALLDPDRIAIGGGIASAGELLFEPIRKTVAQRNTFSEFAPCQIMPATLGNSAGAIGAAALAIEAVRTQEEQ